MRDLKRLRFGFPIGLREIGAKWSLLVQEASSEEKDGE
jgi:hypothetical protein